MDQLNNEQIQQIKAVLNRRGVGRKVVVEELTDHIACAIEQAMQSGIDFQSALSQNMAEFGIGELPSIEQENQRIFNRVHKKRGVFTGVVAAALMLFAVIVRADDRPDIPPYNKNRLAVDGYFSSNINGFIYEISGKLDIYATANGEVYKIVKVDDLENNVSVIMKHANGFQTIYTNLQSVKLKVGEKIKKGGKIGEVRPAKPGQKNYFVYKIMNAGHPIPSNKYY